MTVQAKVRHMSEDEARKVSAKFMGESERRIQLQDPRPAVSDIAIRIRKLREASGLSRPKFAAVLDNMPSTTLKNYELGYREPGAKIIQDIGIVYGPEVLVWLVVGIGVLADMDLQDRLKKYSVDHIVG